jgi:hypothetical protein
MPPTTLRIEPSTQYRWTEPSTSFGTILISPRTRTFLEKPEDRACVNSKTESLSNAISAKSAMLREPTLSTAVSALITQSFENRTRFLVMAHSSVSYTGFRGEANLLTQTEPIHGIRMTYSDEFSKTAPTTRSSVLYQRYTPIIRLSLVVSLRELVSCRSQAALTELEWFWNCQGLRCR